MTPTIDASAPGEQSQPNGAIARGIGVSVALHLLVMFAVWLLPAAPLPPPEPEESVTVEILPEPPAPPPPVVSEPPPTPEQAPPQAPSTASAQPAPEVPKADGMIHAQKLFSTKMLADPRSRSARKAIRQLSRVDRIIQLCDVEAMEQVHNWKPAFQPDLMVAYAMADVKLSGLTLEANGGALREKEHWHEMKFKCEVTADLEKVVAFDFSMGAEIPESEWEAHSLPSGDDSD